MKYTREDMKIVAHECHSQGEFETYNEAYDVLCHALENEGISETWLDTFFRLSKKGPVAVFHDRERQTWNVMGCPREQALEIASKIDPKNIRVVAQDARGREE